MSNIYNFFYLKQIRAELIFFFTKVLITIQSQVSTWSYILITKEILPQLSTVLSKTDELLYEFYCKWYALNQFVLYNHLIMLSYMYNWYQNVANEREREREITIAKTLILLLRILS